MPRDTAHTQDQRLEALTFARCLWGVSRVALVYAFSLHLRSAPYLQWWRRRGGLQRHVIRPCRHFADSPRASAWVRDALLQATLQSNSACGLKWPLTFSGRDRCIRRRAALDEAQCYTSCRRTWSIAMNNKSYCNETIYQLPQTQILTHPTRQNPDILHRFRLTPLGEATRLADRRPSLMC
jgi:hypothetical protein